MRLAGPVYRRPAKESPFWDALAPRAAYHICFRHRRLVNGAATNRRGALKRIIFAATVVVITVAMLAVSSRRLRPWKMGNTPPIRGNPVLSAPRGQKLGTLRADSGISRGTDGASRPRSTTLGTSRAGIRKRVIRSGENRRTYAPGRVDAPYSQAREACSCPQRARPRSHPASEVTALSSLQRKRVKGGKR
jgi:hypothetical protein